MGTKYWIASAIQQTDRWTGTVALTWATGDTATITINGKSLVITIGSLTTTSQVATTIVQAFNRTTFTDTTASMLPISGGTSIAEFSNIIASISISSSSLINFTSLDAGENTISMSSTTAGNGTFTASHAISGTGPNYWDNVVNWDTGSIPVGTDTVIIDTPVSILYGSLDQSAITLTQLTFGENFSSAYVGLPKRNAAGYEEFRSSRLKVHATTVTNDSFSARMRLDLGSAQTAFTQNGSSTLDWIGTHASNVVTLNSGTCYLANQIGELATIATLNISEASVYCGTGLTVTNIVKTSGSLWLSSSSTSLSNIMGSLNLLGGTHTLVTVAGGSVSSTKSSTITSLKMTGGSFESSRTAVAVTVNKLLGTATMAVAPTTTLTSHDGDTTCESGGISGVTTINGGTFYWPGTGTIASLVTNNSPTINFDGGTTAACTVSANNFSKGTTIIDNAKRVVWTGGIVPPAGSIMFM